MVYGIIILICILVGLYIDKKNLSYMLRGGVLCCACFIGITLCGIVFFGVSGSIKSSNYFTEKETIHQIHQLDNGKWYDVQKDDVMENNTVYINEYDGSNTYALREYTFPYYNKDSIRHGITTNTPYIVFHTKYFTPPIWMKSWFFISDKTLESKIEKIIIYTPE